MVRWLFGLAMLLLPSTGRAVCSGTKTCTGCSAPFCDGDVWTCDGFKAANAPCSDNNACTSGDHCDGAGSCVPTSVVSCNPPPDCHLAVSCNTSTGTCPTTYPSKPDGSSCTVGVTANATGQCTAGSCGWTCNSGYLNCNGTCAHCCSNADCPITHGTLTCASGACGGQLHCA